MVESFSITLSPNMLSATEALAERNGMSVADFILNVLAEYIEDAIDVSAADSAHLRYLEDPVSYSMDEVKERYSL